MPKTSPEAARKLARLSSDCSFLLTHMVRQNGKRPKTDVEARQTLLRILGIEPGSRSYLQANPVGWYARLSNTEVFEPSTMDFGRPNECRAVCFTESTLAGLQAHRDVFKVKYGLSFDRDCLFGRGANPCLNIRQNLFKQRLADVPGRSRYLYNFVPRELHPFVNVINEGFDATHEREWRYAGDFEFTTDDVRIVFCPEEDFSSVVPMQRNGLPMLFDLKWLDRL